MSIETGRRTISAPLDEDDAPGEYAVLTVSDTGCGMDETTARKIFEPFFTTKEVGKGTGLGMSIVYGIVKQHNGFINLTTDPGGGTSLTIFIPIYEAEHSDDPEGCSVASTPQVGTETILLAEDDPAVRTLLVSILTNAGYKVIEAVDGEDAIEKFLPHRDEVSLLLMDMIMPKKNGRVAYDEIAMLRPDIKVLYSSGYTADFIQNRGVSEEGIELIMKPVQPLELLRMVRKMLDQ